MFFFLEILEIILWLFFLAFVVLIVSLFVFVFLHFSMCVNMLYFVHMLYFYVFLPVFCIYHVFCSFKNMLFYWITAFLLFLYFVGYRIFCFVVVEFLNKRIQKQTISKILLYTIKNINIYTYIYTNIAKNK